MGQQNTIWLQLHFHPVYCLVANLGGVHWYMVPVPVIITYGTNQSAIGGGRLRSRNHGNGNSSGGISSTRDDCVAAIEEITSPLILQVCIARAYTDCSSECV